MQQVKLDNVKTIIMNNQSTTPQKPENKNIDIILFEIESVKQNRWMTAREKKEKISELKALAPNYPKFKD